MKEIAYLTTQLHAQNKLIAIEEENRKKEDERKKAREEETDRERAEQSNQAQQLLDDQEVDMEDSIRNGLIQDVVNEAEEKGSSLPPSVIRLLNHLKSKIDPLFI